MAKNLANEVMKRLTLAKNLSDKVFNAPSLYFFIASVAQLCPPPCKNLEVSIASHDPYRTGIQSCTW
jgi:hypothetical protein